MTLQDYKDYISSLCVQVYGVKPKDVVPCIKTYKTVVDTAFSMSNPVELGGVFFVSHFWFAHSKKVASMQNFIAFGVHSATSKSMLTSEISDVEMLAKYMRVTSSEAGDVDITLTGFKCVL